MQNNFLATSDYWDDRYLHQDTAWDMGHIPKPPARKTTPQAPAD
ncbi:MAG TPA: hypothetical protein VNS58_18335 [Puia sp.]|nr:hypothetical protein [Puia sp.]